MKFRSRQRQETGFQVAPMLDIFMILLCFFAVTQFFAKWETELDLKIPSSDTGSLAPRAPGEIILNVHPDGQVVIHGRKHTDEELLGLLSRIVNLFEGQPVIIRADETTDYKHLIHVLDVCRKADVYNISFATVKAEK
jgi:biopolymer transport protein ExbD